MSEKNQEICIINSELKNKLRQVADVCSSIKQKRREAGVWYLKYLLKIEPVKRKIISCLRRLR